MGKKFLSRFVIYVGFLLMSLAFYSCEKEVLFSTASIETSQVTSVTEATAKCGGSITFDGGSNVTARGVCWSITPNPTIEDDTTINDAGSGQFNSLIKGLNPSTTYFVRAYAVNKGGIGYGLQVTFTTKTYSITTTPIALSFVTATSAIGGGNIISDGDSSILTVKTRGVCWNTFPSPTIENRRTIDGVGGGRFTSSIDSLMAFTTYYARAYATNINGTIYGNEVIFTTLSGIIELSTNQPSLIGINTATISSTISNDGGATITERGICWNTNPNPTIANAKDVNGSGIGTFTTNIAKLLPNTTYFVRTYATNGLGTKYGNEVSFKTQSGIIELSTDVVSSIKSSSATFGCTIISDGGALVSERGICWSSSPNPTIDNAKTNIGSGIGTFSAKITGLSPNTTYFVRSFAINSQGVSYGNEVSFKTLSGLIELTHTIVSSINTTTANVNATISADGGDSITYSGFCWNTVGNPTTSISSLKVYSNNAGLGKFSAFLTRLKTNTTYFIRPFAANSIGIVYGNEIEFKTLSELEKVSDIEGNIYNCITIGTQVWMVENLKTTKYNDGTPIPYISDKSVWANLSTPGFCWYNNNLSSNKDVYGGLYNWYTVKTNKLAPIGWHIPSNDEWATLERYLIENYCNYDGSPSGNKLAKSIATSVGWEKSTSEGAIGNNFTQNNSSGFTGVPGGFRDIDGEYYNVSRTAFWWCSTEINSNGASARRLSYEFSAIYNSGNIKQCGLSVRCIKDY